MSWRDYAVPDPAGFSPAAPSSTESLPADFEFENANATIPGELARFGVHALPGAGALAGGALGMMTGPAAPYFSPLLAGMGGVAGRWGEHMLAPHVGYETEQPTMESAQNEALMDITLGAGGSLVRAPMRRLAEESGRYGLRMPPTWREDWQRLVPGTETPEQFMIRTRNVTAREAQRYARGAARLERGATRAAERAGHRIRPGELASRSLEEAREVTGPLTARQRGDIIRRTAGTADELLRIRGRGTSPRPPLKPGMAISDYGPTQVRHIKQTAGSMSRGSRAQERLGRNLSADPEELIDLSRSARESLRRIPGVGKFTTESQKAINLQRALQRAEAVSHTSLPQLAAAGGGGLTAAAFGHGGAVERGLEGVVTAGLMHQATSPAAFRRYALVLANPAFQRGVQLAPLATSAAIRPLIPPPSQSDFER